MKSFYLYVPDGDSMTFDSVVVWLSVGTHRSDQTKLTLLECFAADNESFLRVRDVDTDFWLDQHAKQLFPDSRCPRLHLQSVIMPIAMAYRMTIDGTLENFVRKYPRRIHFLKTLFHLDSQFMRNHTQIPCITSCPRGKRKNLSQSIGNCIYYATLPITLLMLGGLVDKLGMYLINLLF